MRNISLALIGLGTVGTGTARLLLEQRDHLRYRSGIDLDLKWVVVRNAAKPRSVNLSNARLTTNLDDVLNDPEVTIAAEVMGGVEPAFDVISRLLRSGKHVVTANKAVLAEHGRELFELAHQQDRAICFEAAVAGGIPIIAAVGDSLAPNRILSIAGILNGTSNYILSAMTDERLSYATALSQAQAQGFAEADPTLDINGTDAAQKLAILCRLGFQSCVDASKVSCRGLDVFDAADVQYASELGYVIKLMAVARRLGEDLHARVAPALVYKTHPMGQVRGEANAIQVVGNAVGEVFFAGKGAGMMPTASSVVAGILDLATGRGQATFRSLKLWEEDPPGPTFAPDKQMHSRFYLRYTIDDRPGTLAQIAGILGNHGVSIASVIQHEAREESVGAPVPLVIMTHVAREEAVWAALHDTQSLAVVRQPTVVLHVHD